MVNTESRLKSPVLEPYNKFKILILTFWIRRSYTLHCKNCERNFKYFSFAPIKNYREFLNSLLIEIFLIEISLSPIKDFQNLKENNPKFNRGALISGSTTASEIFASAIVIQHNNEDRHVEVWIPSKSKSIYQ